MAAATLQRVMHRKTEAGRTFNVAVVGLSGTERDKGAVGVGKSCLCNRFVRAAADHYYTEHISVLSQTDFSGRVVNNEHFMYWGEATKVSEEGIPFQFSVVEQTEFIDDASFQPFKAGKMDPYTKRCANTRLCSAEKLMYICKNQLGIEKEYEQKVLPDGRFLVDGFLCVFDVSEVAGRPLSRQVELTVQLVRPQILGSLLRTKKPVVLVTTKNDEARESHLREAERLASRKEFKGNIPLVETSAHQGVNVDLAFITLAQLIDRGRGRVRIVPYPEAARQRRDDADLMADAFQSLVRTHVTDWRATWPATVQRLRGAPAFAEFTELHGQEAAHRLFRRYVKRLREEHVSRRVQRYLSELPDVLRELFADQRALLTCSWQEVQQSVRRHPDFERHFVAAHEDLAWLDLDLDELADARIPFEVLTSSEAETAFKNYLNAIQQETRQQELRRQFKQLLEETSYVTPGKSLSEVRVLFLGRECFESLAEEERQEIYDLHQRHIVEKARVNFQELLLERADLFYGICPASGGGALSPDQIKDITELLQEDVRYKLLDRFEQERQLVLLQHLGFLHRPRPERCPSAQLCMELQVWALLADRAAPAAPAVAGTHWVFAGGDSAVHPLNAVLVGSEGAADRLTQLFRLQLDEEEVEIDSQLFRLDLRVISDDTKLTRSVFFTPDFTPHGCLCVFSNAASFEYLRQSVEKTLLSSLQEEEEEEQEEEQGRPPFQGLPLVLVLAADPQLGRAELAQLRQDGRSLADSLQSPFVDCTPPPAEEEPAADAEHVLPATSDDRLTAALAALVHSVRRPAGLPACPALLTAREPDIRIIMCLFCGDPYSVENVVGAILSNQTCQTHQQSSVILDTFLGDCRRRVEVIISSYHGAAAYQDEMVHGFILVYSTKRRASLNNLNVFSASVPHLPVQILAVTDSGGANALFSSQLTHQLITEGNHIADRLQAHFMTSTSTCQQKSAFYLSFFKEVWEKKPEIEEAFELERVRRLERAEQLAALRRGLSIPAGTASNDGSGSEIYERLPTDGSLADELNLSPTLDERPLSGSDDDNEVAADETAGEQRRPANGEHPPRRTLQQELLCQTFLSTESLPAGLCQPRPGRSSRAPFSRARTEQLPPPPPRHHFFKAESVELGRRPPPDHRMDGADTGGWLQEPSAGRTLAADDVWSERRQWAPHAYTTGRGRPAPPPRTRQDSQPGKLNLTQYSSVVDTLDKLNLSSRPEPRRSQPQPGVSMANSEYAQVKDALLGGGRGDGDYSYTVTQEAGGHSAKARLRQRTEQCRQLLAGSESEESAPEEESTFARQKYATSSVRLRRTAAKRGGVPAAIPRVPALPTRAGGSPLPSKSKSESPRDGGNNDESSVDVSVSAEYSSPLLSAAATKEEKLRRKDRQRQLKEDERRRLKDEEKARKLEKERIKKEKSTKKGKTSTSSSQSQLEELVPGGGAGGQLPLFLTRCVEYIEAEGLDTEGLYRVPGNRQHVDLLFERLAEDPAASIGELDLAVNAVATALKEFLSKRLPPLLTQEKMAELTAIAGVSDRRTRLFKLTVLLKDLPPVNFNILKYLFRHFGRVSDKADLNSMDSKNLAICWWPTLLPLQFTDMAVFESMRPHLEDIVQTMIKQPSTCLTARRS
ncbi:rho GTPase-activating protein 190-like isoform X3 [Amphibalanus amphitrite]|uniref:rho GTPase-activating protein 190-like isoform X3 n=1 Tax=Amphibalanus amphitrite TaxID=1232801 RepID=UPI001C922C67|nr:rho GTPase-activating protein 190-like isoform X3 [Amphibalanus amphitrite]